MPRVIALLAVASSITLEPTRTESGEAEGRRNGCCDGARDCGRRCNPAEPRRLRRLDRHDSAEGSAESSKRLGDLHVPHAQGRQGQDAARFRRLYSARTAFYEAFLRHARLAERIEYR